MQQESTPESEFQVPSQLDQEALNKWFDERLEQKLRERAEARTPQLSLIATKGTLDMAYPPLYSCVDRSGSGLGCILLFYILRTEPSEERFEPCCFAAGQSCDANENAVWPRLVQKCGMEYTQCTEQ